MKTLLVDNHPLFRCGLRMVLSDLDPDLVCLQADGVRGAAAFAGPCGDGVELVLHGVPDHGETAARLTGELRALFPDVMLIALVDVDDAALARRCVLAGASGVVAKSAPPPVLVETLRAVLQGRVMLPPSLIEVAGAAPVQPRPSVEGAFVARLPYDADDPSVVDGPDAFDQELLWLSIRGLSIARIAERCALSCQAVEQRLGQAYRQMGVADRAGALIAAAASGLTGLLPLHPAR